MYRPPLPSVKIGEGEGGGVCTQATRRVFRPREMTPNLRDLHNSSDHFKAESNSCFANSSKIFHTLKHTRNDTSRC